MSFLFSEKDRGGVFFKLHGDLIEHVIETRRGQRRKLAGGFAGAVTNVAHVLFGGSEVGSGHGEVF